MLDIDDDLNDIVSRAAADLFALSGARIFITGGTGYIGRWLMAGILRANHEMNLGIHLTVLSRNVDGFAARYCGIAHDPTVTYLSGDIRDFSWPEADFSHVIHGATDVLAVNPPLQTFDVIANGTSRLLKFCSDRKIPNILLLSSGAVYGDIPHEVDRVTENFKGTIDLLQPSSAYGLGKMAMEWQAAVHAAETGMHCKIARIFAQVGPSLALNKHFAVGNFLADALNGGRFRIKGAGTPLRSYMYPTDLVVWILAMLVRGRSCYPYNVGSDQPISILELANRIARIANINSPTMDIENRSESGLAPDRYIPDINRAKTELGLQIMVDLDDALAKTWHWNMKHYTESHE